MKITIIRHNGSDIVADRVIVDEELLELGDYNLDQSSLGDQLSGQIFKVAQLKDIFSQEDNISQEQVSTFTFKLSKSQDHKVYLKSDAAFKLIFRDILTTLPEETELRIE